MTSAPRTATSPTPQPAARGAQWAREEVARLTELQDQLPAAGTAPDVAAKIGMPEDTGVDVLRERLTVMAGQVVAERAEQIAGITAQEAYQSFQSRLEKAKSTYDQVKQLYETAREELGLHELRKTYQRVDSELWRMRPPREGADKLAVESHWKTVDALQAERERLSDEIERVEALVIERVGEPSVQDAERAWWRTREGRDEQTRADLRRLADGYTKAVAEVRQLGGEHRWHEKSNKQAQVRFDEALALYPSDWIAASDAHLLAVVKLTKARAHYSPGAPQTTKKRVTLERHWNLPPGEQPDEWRPPVDGVYERRGDAAVHWERRPDEDSLSGHAWSEKLYELYSPYQHRMTASGKPVGNGWEEFRYRDNGKVRTWWRRARTETRTLKSEVVPELTTDRGRDRADVVSAPGGSTAIHELAHRFEHTVAGISELEAAFLRRRTTGPDGQREKLVPYLGRRRERTRPDSFANAYIGREYDDPRFHEVLSVGMESLFSGNNGGLVGLGDGRPMDTDHRAFVLGVLTTAGRRARTDDRGERD